MELILEKRVCYKLGRVFVDECEYNRPYYFADLVVHEALSKDLKTNKIIFQILGPELHYVSLSLGIFCFEPFGVIMEVVGSYKLLTAPIDKLEQL